MGGKGKDKGKGSGKGKSADKGKGKGSKGKTEGKAKPTTSSEAESKWVQVKGTALVTGASGFLAMNVIRRLLDRGYKVRGTVRSLTDEKKVAVLKQTFPTVELFEADLLGGQEPFEKAMEGCKYVLHCASPFQMSHSDPQKDFVEPAVKGTEAVMQAAVEAGVSRVVVTSSVAACGPPQEWADKPYELEKPVSPEDWNTTSTLQAGPYRLSKRLAEEKAWEIAKANPSLALVTILPSFVLGPMIGSRCDSVSVNFIKNMLDGTAKEKGLGGFCKGVVDVRDVSLAHVSAMELAEAAGKRFLVTSAEGFTDIELADKLRQKFKAYPLPVDGPRPEFRAKYDVTLTKELLKFKPRPVEITMSDMANAAIRNGIVQKKYKLKPANFMKVADIMPDGSGLNLLVKVVSMKDPADGKGGKKVQEIVVGDASGTVAILLSGEEVSQAAADNMLEIRNASVRMNGGFVRVQVGKWGKVGKYTGDADTSFTVKMDKESDVSQVEYELVEDGK